MNTGPEEGLGNHFQFPALKKKNRLVEIFFLLSAFPESADWMVALFMMGHRVGRCGSAVDWCVGGS